MQHLKKAFRHKSAAPNPRRKGRFFDDLAKPQAEKPVALDESAKPQAGKPVALGESAKSRAIRRD